MSANDSSSTAARPEPLDHLDVLGLLRARVNEAGSQTAFAEKAGVSLSYLNDMMLGRRVVGKRVLKALGLRRMTVYEWEES